MDFKDTPWGRWEVLLDSHICKVKRITVKPGQRLSLQKHFKRREFWTIVQGTATVTIDDVIQDYHEDQIAVIPQGAVHRIENRSSEDVIFIEIQRGTYFGEDDIIRLEDDYGRS